jgi:riboflavin kinase/FMN adenylyltransferase
MKIYSLSDLPLPFSTVITIGAFDGLHIGHLRLLEETKKIGEELLATPVMLTFSPHPREVLRPQVPFYYLTLLDEKIEILSALSFPCLVVLPFTRSLAELTPDIFVEQYLVDYLKVKAVVVGYNFRFGRGRSGDAEYLLKMGKKYDFMVRVVEPVEIDGIKISSSLIRELLLKGEVERANRLLGRPYSLKGRVITGKGRGRILGFPTANLEIPSKKLIPKEGVYAAWVGIENKRFMGALNIGKNPTFEDKKLSIEVHILDFSEDLYNKTIKVELIKYIRGEQKFPSVEKLVEQIKKDCQVVKEVLSG